MRLAEAEVMAVSNQLLRDSVTSVAFSLALGKTHVAALVLLDLELAAEVFISSGELAGTPHCRSYSHFVTGRGGLIRRGLIAHVFEANKHKFIVRRGDQSRYRPGAVDMDRMPIGQVWNITRAGRLVIELLQESGLYGEYAGPLLPLVEAKRAERKAS